MHTLIADFSSKDMRSTVGLFATGIAVVTTRLEGVVQGITINSFSSVSLEPPLVLFCLDLHTASLDRLQRVDRFAISFLSAHQEAQSRLFAGQPGVGALPEPLHWGDDVAFLTDAAGGLRCEVHQQIPAGDHMIVLARVTGVWQDAERSDPLLYFRGRYEVGRFGRSEP